MQAIPKWEHLFTSATSCLSVSATGSCVVAASESGELAWLKLDDSLAVEKIGQCTFEWRMALAFEEPSDMCRFLV